MPFTPAHAAIVLPLLKTNRRYLSATGLIAGSIAPDFEYFLKFSIDSIYSHTLWGIIWFNIPISFLIAWLFHSYVKCNLMFNLPQWIRRRFLPLLQLDFIGYVRANPLAFIFSIIIGASSHVFWDAFTHNNGFFVQRLSFYEGSSIHLDGVDYPLWYALQHISTYVGLFLITIYIIFLPEVRDDDAATRKPSVLYWALVLSVATLAVAIRFMIYSEDYNTGNLVVSGISGICIGLVAGNWIRIDLDSQG